MKKNQLIVFVCLLLAGIKISAQEWTLKLRSSVELRTFRLTNKTDISESKLAGATIALYKGSTLVNQIQSDGNGDFIIDVPANGDFVLTVTYSGCNPKKFAISTMGVPAEIAKDNYKPSFGIEGVIMAKAFPTIDYSVLNQPLARIVYTSNGKKFDDEQYYTNQMLDALSRIRDAENKLIESFTSTNNTGDVALSKGDCPLAKASYEKAMTIIPGETYPGAQLPKVGDCLNNKDQAAKKAEEEAAAKAAAAKLEAEKAEADKLAKEKAAKEKIESDKLTKDKAAQEAIAKATQAETEKAQKDKLAAEKLEADKLTKDKTAQAAAEKAAKVAAEKAQKDASVKAAKAEADKQAKEKEAADKIAKETPKEPAKEKTTTPTKEPTNGIAPSTGSEPGTTGVNTGEAKYSIPQALGSDKYKATIKRADELFKMKRYAEAKPMYEEALKLKLNDAAATNKLVEIEKLIKK